MGGIAARESVDAFATAMAQLDELMQDSDDDTSAAPRPVASPMYHSSKKQRIEDDGTWQFHCVGLEMQRPWSQMVLMGTKRIETRRYPLPPALLGRELLLLESQEAAAQVSSLPDLVPEGDPLVQAIGTVTFSACITYATFEEWLADEPRHCVTADSHFAWAADQKIFGWVVDKVAAYEVPSPAPALQRRYRSLFQVRSDPWEDSLNASSVG